VASWFSIGNAGYEGYPGTGATNYTEWELGVTMTYDKYALDLGRQECVRLTSEATTPEQGSG